MQKCENCRWNIPDDASSCPYCGHLFHPDSQEEEERRKRLLHWHMFNAMRQKKSYVPLSTLASAAAAESLLPKTTGLSAIQWVGLPAVKVILVVAASLVLVTGSVSAFVVLSHGSHVVMTPTATPNPSACANSTIPPTPGAGNGTNLIFTFSRAAPSPMCVVRNDGCITSQPSGPYSGYGFFVLGTVNGTLYTFLFETAAYTGPGTYTKNAMIVLELGDYKLNGPLSGWSAPFTGTVIVNGDGKSGSVKALLNHNINTSGTVQVTGNWTCSVGLGQPR